MMIYELKISLEDLPLPVSRTIQLSSDFTFYDLHDVIIASFNWEDASPHIFEAVKTDGEIVQNEVILSYYDMTTEEDGKISFQEAVKDPNTVYEDDVLLSDYFKEVDDTVLYKYDRPDFWKHVITLEQIIHTDKELDIPVCIGAENDAPEEHTQEDIHTFDEELRNDDSVALVREINTDIELAFDEELWDEEIEQELEGIVDDLLSQVFGEFDSFSDEDEEEPKN